ncbi:MAG: hypothetical protein SynsKO_41150 [Synoicihabitans sp.]
MKLTRPKIFRFLAGMAGAILLSTSLFAQAQFAGRYIGSLNASVSAGGFALESGVGVYFADVDSSGAIDFNGVISGTVDAGGNVTFTGGTQFALLGITSATISNGTLSSDYGALVGNGTTRYRINPSTGFTSADGGSGGGGSGGGGSGGGSGGSSGDLLAYYSFDDASNLLKDDSGRGVDLSAVGGAVSAASGGAVNGALSTNNVRMRALVNQSFSSEAVSISYFVRVRGAGNWNPRMVAVLKPGTSSHHYGTFLDGTNTSAGRRFASYYESNRGVIDYSPESAVLPTEAAGSWHHIAMTHDGSTLKLYLDGSEVVSQSAQPLRSFSSAMLSIAGADNGLDLFTGDLDEIRIYNRAITAAEISTLSGGGAVGEAGDDTGSTGSISADVIAAPNNLVGFRNRSGQSLQFSVTGSTSGTIWGSGIYTDDSSVAAAAVHAGVVAPGQTAEVTINILGGQSSYPATTANGVTSRSWGAWGGSFSFADAPSVTIGQVATAPPTVASNFVINSFTPALGQRLVLPIQVDGIGPFAFQWYLNGVAINGATANPYVIDQVSSAVAGNYTVQVTNAAGSVTLNAGTVAVNGAGAPVFVLQPFDKVVAPGGTFALAASAVGANISYQWYLNGVLLNGETGSILLRENANSGDAGQYTVRVSNSDGTITSQAATVSLSQTSSTLRNISVRTNASPGQVITPGFVIRGAGSKQVLIRAIGPGLEPYLSGFMTNPKVTVFDSNQNVVATNDDWNSSIAGAFNAVGAFAIEDGSADAALLVSLPANNSYTAQVTSSDGPGGIVLLEVYDADENPTSKLVNVSVRSNADAGADALIMGMSLQGTGKRTLLVRGIGPTLGTYGVPGTINDPEMTIFDVNQRAVLSNGDWSNADFVYELLQATDFVGAFSLGAGSTDAATLSLLDPGNYTIQITPTDGNDGEALAEIYEVP